VFERLFGDGGSAEARQARMRSQGSILDSLRAEVSRVSAELGGGDKVKLGEYLDSVREVEQRIQNSESQPLDIELPERPARHPERFDEHTKLMFDLTALAFRADVTRVFSMIMSRELSTRTFAHIGVPEQHHAVSHHRNDPDSDREEGQDRLPPGADAGLPAREAAGDAGRRRHAARSLADALRRRHGRRQPAPARRSAVPDGREAGRRVQAGPAPPLPGRHADDQPAADRARRRGVPIEKLGDSTGRLPLTV
jgi:hypothetical protein